MTTNPLVRLGQLGQSPWYDFITRDLVRSGELARLIAEDGLLGMTSNPTIFEKAIASSGDYDADIRRLSHEGRSPAEIFEALAVADVQAACDVFRPVYDRLGNGDGTVSIEVSPTLAHDTDGTAREADRLWKAVARPNVLIKIPGTAAGLPAITRCLAAGINVNVTLLFSVERYRQVVEAHMAGLEARAMLGKPLASLHSVASFFVSRVDGIIDKQLDERGAPAELRGTAAIANACVAYELFERALRTDRWRALADAGAVAQRPLWASTGTKNPAYSDTYYVEALVAPSTVNTLPPDTFAAYRDHGDPAVRVPRELTAAHARLAAIQAAGVDLAAATQQLEADGVAKFAASFRSLLAGIAAKAGALAAR